MGKPMLASTPQPHDEDRPDNALQVIFARPDNKVRACESLDIKCLVCATLGLAFQTCWYDASCMVQLSNLQVSKSVQGPIPLEEKVPSS